MIPMIGRMNLNAGTDCQRPSVSIPLRHRIVPGITSVTMPGSKIMARRCFHIVVTCPSLALFEQSAFWGHLQLPLWFDDNRNCGASTEWGHLPSSPVDSRRTSHAGAYARLSLPGLALAGQTPSTDRALFFAEGFEDTRLMSRGWYDGDRFVLSDDAVAGKHAIQYHFAKGKLTPSDSSGIRHSIEPTEVVYLRFYLKLSPNWSWTNKPYGPHLLHFMTTENDKYHGPAASHLTLYIEPVNGKLRLAAQDIQNRNMPHGLTQGPLRGGYNGQFFDSEEVLFNDGKWHCVEAMFKLNSLDMARDKPNHDGELRGWVDGKLVIVRTDVVFRSTDFPKMKFNQFMMLPYFHDGVPHDQTLWIDELAVGMKRIGANPRPGSSRPGEQR